MERSNLALPALLAIVVALAACSQPAAIVAVATPPPQAPYDKNDLPAGPLGDSIRYGHELIANTHALMPHNVVAAMNCSACHINAGTSPGGGSLIGVYAHFPQWNRRSHRIIALQDRVAECFLYSMNGKPPAYWSREMVAIIAYVAWLSRGVPTLSSPPPAKPPLDIAHADPARGQAIYASKCSACHGASGAGEHGAFPPLWGPTSFNHGAGMAHVPQMARFVHLNMPQNAPGSLSPQEAVDVSAYVLTHERPSFHGSRGVIFQGVPARTF